MGDTAVLRPITGPLENRVPPGTGNDDDPKGSDLEFWSGELPFRLIGYLNRVNPWDLRGLSGLVVRHAEVRELANTGRMLHQVIDLGSRRASQGRWKYDEAIAFRASIRMSIRRLHREVQEAARRGRIFMNSDDPSGNRGPRHA